MVLCLLFPGCAKVGLTPGNAGQSVSPDPAPDPDPAPGELLYYSYRDMPDISPEEIAAIDALRQEGRAFIYGMAFSSECFADRNDMGGYSVLFCQWIGRFLGLRFTPAIYDWTDLINGLETGKVDFTGELTITPERLKKYAMTSSIAERSVTITKLNNSIDPSAIAARRRPRLAFYEGSTTPATILSVVSYDFDTLYADSLEEAFQMIRTGEADAFIEESYEGEAIMHEDLSISEFFPPIYSSVSMSTEKKELAPVISVVQKYLDHGGINYLTKLFNQGYKNYLTYRFHAFLTEEELAYAVAHDGSKGTPRPIPLVMENSNYPVSFYNKTEGAWQGLAWDVLQEITAISGIQFKVVSHENDNWSTNVAQLKSGEASIISELIRTADREEHFIWASMPFTRDNFALISKVEKPDMNVGEVLYSTVGIVKDAGEAEFFHHWFPDHQHVVEYSTVEDALESLKKGEIDLLMGTRNTLLTLTNYMEEPGFKANLIFHRTADSYFGFNRDEAILSSIISKAQTLVNTERLENRWLSRLFDYRSKLVRARQPYLIGFSILLGMAIFLLIALLQKYRESRQELEIMVKFRTRELEERTQELEVQKNAVQTAYRVKSRFLANMSHELRTPLNAIIGLSQEEMEKNHSLSRENLASINYSGSTLLSVVNDLLDISNIESGEMELKPADYLLPVLINDSSVAVRMRIGDKPIVFQLELNEELPVKLHGDKQRIVQILSNLLSNAVKFTYEGSITLRVDFEASPGKNAAEEIQLCFEVRDTGIGIKAGDMQRLFTDYSQANTTGGTGMGLLITKKLAELMGGSIGAMSEYGKGTVFTVRIPQKVTAPAVLGSDTAEKLRAFDWKEPQKEKPLLSYARVLVVDDVPTNHAVARGLMKPYKMTVDAVLSGQESVDLITAEKPHYDAIFMDHMMPGMDGIEATRRIRALDSNYAKNIPVIALTANALPENEKLFLENGFNAFMTKPIDINVLTQVLIKWVQDPEKEQVFAGEEEETKEDQKSVILDSCSVEGVDLTAGATQFGGADAYLEIVKVFISDTPKLLENIKNWLDGFRIMPAAAAAALDALDNYTITVHGIKGSCYGICATPVGDLAKELEMAAKNHNLGKVLELNSRFVQAAEKLVGELKSLFPLEGKPRLEKNAPDPALLQKLLDAARAYNINEMFETLSALEAYNYREGGEVVQALRKAADSYEYSEVINLISDFQKPEDDAFSETAG